MRKISNTSAHGTFVRRRPWSFAAHAVIFACTIAAAHADETLTYTHQGVERAAVLHQAPSAANPAPLVITLQGLGQSIEGVRDALKLDPVADREGFAVLYPDAIEHRWSYGRPIIQAMPTVGSETVDDIGFVRLAIDDLVSRKIRRSRARLRHCRVARRADGIHARLRAG
jgi:polyhydroxybutyrate depolymerase